MTKRDLRTRTTAELVEYFAEIGVAQNAALLRDEIKKFNRLYDEKKAIEDELKAREGDQRRALMALYRHSDMQVRLNAATATLAVVPEAARKQVEEIAESGWFPQAGDAGMCLWSLEGGIFKPS